MILHRSRTARRGGARGGLWPASCAMKMPRKALPGKACVERSEDFCAPGARKSRHMQPDKKVWKETFLSGWRREALT